MFETPFGEPGQFAVEATKGATLSFSTVAAGGQYIVRPYELGGWFVHSVTLGGKDITDRAFDLAGGRDVAGRDLHGSAVEGVRHRD